MQSCWEIVFLGAFAVVKAMKKAAVAGDLFCSAQSLAVTAQLPHIQKNEGYKYTDK